jgi:hypothetical protein
MSKLTVACSPLTGTIFAGKPLKSGTWGAIKHDVTDDAVRAVATHFLIRKEKMTFGYMGKRYTIQVIEEPITPLEP